jgi:hypothetical protein
MVKVSYSGLASIKGPGYSSIFFVDLFVPKIKLREREHVWGHLHNDCLFSSIKKLLKKIVHSWKSAAAPLIIIEGQFQVIQRFSSSKLALETVESGFAALNYYENGSSVYVD